MRGLFYKHILSFRWPEQRPSCFWTRGGGYSTSLSTLYIKCLENGHRFLLRYTDKKIGSVVGLLMDNICIILLHIKYILHLIKWGKNTVIIDRICTLCVLQFDFKIQYVSLHICHKNLNCFNPCLVHAYCVPADYIQRDRNLLRGHNGLFLWEIMKDIFSCIRTYIW